MDGLMKCVLAEIVLDLVERIGIGPVGPPELLHQHFRSLSIDIVNQAVNLSTAGPPLANFTPDDFQE